jgi:hypothetical protein
MKRKKNTVSQMGFKKKNNEKKPTFPTVFFSFPQLLEQSF